MTAQLSSPVCAHTSDTRRCPLLMQVVLQMELVAQQRASAELHQQLQAVTAAHEQARLRQDEELAALRARCAHAEAGGLEGAGQLQERLQQALDAVKVPCPLLTDCLHCAGCACTPTPRWWAGTAAPAPEPLGPCTRRLLQQLPSICAEAKACAGQGGHAGQRQ